MLMLTRLTHRGIRGVFAAAHGLATFIGGIGLIVIMAEGTSTTWQHFNRSPDPKDSWIGLIVIICAGYAAYLGIKGIGSLGLRHDEGAKLYAELYTAATEVKEAGEALLDATARESRGEVISAELRWHHAVAALKMLAK